jgi:hypothetical protein
MRETEQWTAARNVPEFDDLNARATSHNDVRCQPPHTSHWYGVVLARRPRGAFISAIERASASLAYRSLVAHAARRRSRSAL